MRGVDASVLGEGVRGGGGEGEQGGAFHEVADEDLGGGDGEVDGFGVGAVGGEAGEGRVERGGVGVGVDDDLWTLASEKQRRGKDKRIYFAR